jgi:FAD/FMN-containing dehydrogenase
MNLKDALKPLIAGELFDDDAALDEASRDASLFEIKPSLVVAPKDAKDICALVKYVNEHPDDNLSLTPRSAGTDMSGGPLSESIVVDMKPHFKEILKVDANGWAEVEPGVFYRDFEKATLEKGLLLPCYTASRELNTVGGMVGNNSGGEKTLSYGKTEDYIEELHVVLSDGKEYVVKELNKKELTAKMAQEDFEGQLYRDVYHMIESNYDAIKEAKPHVSKNSAGYFLWNVWDREKGTFNLNKVIVGAQGTLGIVTKIKFRLVKPKPHSRLLVIFLANFENLGDMVNEVLAFKPESFESYDDHTLKLAMRFAPDIAKSLKGSMIGLAFDFIPEAFTVLAMGGLPKLVLMAEFTAETEEEAEATAKAAQEKIAPRHLHTLVTGSEREGKKYWTVRRESFSLLRHHVKEKHTAPFIDDTAVRPDQLPEFLPALDKIMSKYDLIYTIAGHIGDANFHIIPLMDLSDPKTQDIIPQLSREVYDLIYSFKGTITAEHGDGLIHSPFLKGMYGQKIYSLFEETKKIFDPNNVFNPGKKVGSNLNYAMHHFVNDAHVRHDGVTRWANPEPKKA